MSRTALLLSLLALLIASLIAPSAHAETGADTAVPPVCGTPDYDEWVTHVGTYADDLTGSGVGDLKLHVGWEVGVGAGQQCAFQSKQVPHQVCTGAGGGPPCTTAYTFAPHVAVTAFPDTIDAAGGDHQNVTVGAPGLSDGAIGFGSCWPGTTYTPGYCDPSLFKFDTGGFPYNGAQMLYRFRDETGHFRGPWTLSYGRLTPGFRIEHTKSAPCGPASITCDYDVIFTRDPLNKPIVTKDAQVLLILESVHTGAVGSPQYISEPAAVPMLIVQSGGGDASGGGAGAGGAGGGAGSTVTPVAGGGGAGTGTSGGGAGGRSVPAKPAAPRAVKPPRLGALAKSGKLTVTVPGVPAGARVDGDLLVSAAVARGLGLKVPAGRGTVALGKASAAATANGPLTATLTVKLTKAARAALARAARRHRRVKATLSVVAVSAGGASAPTTAALTLKP